MTTKRTIALITLIALAGLALGLWAYPRLPEQVPSHWNAAGEVDDTQPRAVAVYLLPGLALALGLLLLFLPNIDPLRANVARFRGAYNWFVAGFVAFLVYLHGLVILAGLGVSFNMTHLLIPPVSLGLAGIGFMVERTRPNWFIGIRTPWTLSSPSVWDKTHRLGGRLFKLSGALVWIGLLLPPQAAFFLTNSAILFTAVATIIYSYAAYRAEAR